MPAAVRPAARGACRRSRIGDVVGCRARLYAQHRLQPLWTLPITDDVPQPVTGRCRLIARPTEKPAERASWLPAWPLLRWLVLCGQRRLMSASRAGAP